MSAIRTLSHGLLFCAVVLGVLFGIRGLLDSYSVKSGWTAQQIVTSVRDAALTARLRPKGPSEFRVAYLGDSIQILAPDPLTVPRQLQMRLRDGGRQGPDFRVVSFAHRGMGAFDFYFLADVIAQAEPDLVVLPFNLSNPGERWRQEYPRPELAGWIDPSRVAEASLLPISHAELTLDQLLFSFAIVHLGAFDLWHRLTIEQIRMGNARGALAEAMAVHDEDTPSPEKAAQNRRYFRRNTLYSLKGGVKRYNAAGVRRLVGASLDGLTADHPVLVAFGAAIRSFDRHDIPVLAYVAPLNYEHFEKLGVLDEERLAISVAAVERVALENGASFRDFHRLLPDAYFEDFTGHLHFEGDHLGMSRLADAIAPEVEKAARSHDPARRLAR